jgi:hypothetical protein
MRLLRVLLRHLRRSVACADFADARTSGLAQPASAPTGTSGGELHRLRHRLRNQDMRRALWEVDLRYD